VLQEALRSSAQFQQHTQTLVTDMSWCPITEDQHFGVVNFKPKNYIGWSFVSILEVYNHEVSIFNISKIDLR
jgi:hypothetical protein